MAGIDTFIERLTRAAQRANVPLEEPDLRKRLKAYAAEHKLKIKLPARQTLYNWIAGKAPDSGNIFLLADALDVDARWLATGSGAMERGEEFDPDEIFAIKDVYRPLRQNAPAKLNAWLRDGGREVDKAKQRERSN